MAADQKTLIVYVKLQFLGPVIINLPSRKIIIWAVLIGMKKTLHLNAKDSCQINKIPLKMGRKVFFIY